MPERLFQDQDALAALCRKHAIRRLSLFGSMLKGSSRPDSDVDLLVEFVPGSEQGFLGLAEIEMQLSALLGGLQVDLRTPADLQPAFSRRGDRVRRRLNMSPDDRVRILHMLEAAEAIATFIMGRERGAQYGSDVVVRVGSGG